MSAVELQSIFSWIIFSPYTERGGGGLPVRSFIARMHAKRGRRAPLLFTVEELPPACAIYAHSFFSAGALPPFACRFRPVNDIQSSGGGRAFQALLLRPRMDFSGRPLNRETPFLDPLISSRPVPDDDRFWIKGRNMSHLSFHAEKP